MTLKPVAPRSDILFHPAQINRGGEAGRVHAIVQRITQGFEAALAGLVILMMLAIVVQVVCNALDINPLMTVSEPILLVGRALTLNSLLDAQWHLLVVLGLVPAGWVWLQDRHVRVDFLVRRYRPVWQARLDLAGNAVFAAPFLAFILPAAWTFMERAWRSDEGSRNGGLEDLWLIKSVLPLGLSILAVSVLLETARRLRAAR